MADGLQEVRFGEYLVQSGALTRQQLLNALMFQDRHPRRRIGECAAALGYLELDHVEALLARWHGIEVLEIG